MSSTLTYSLGMTKNKFLLCVWIDEWNHDSDQTLWSIKRILGSWAQTLNINLKSKKIQNYNALILLVGSVFSMTHYQLVHEAKKTKRKIEQSKIILIYYFINNPMFSKLYASMLFVLIMINSRTLFTGCCEYINTTS